RSDIVSTSAGDGKVAWYENQGAGIYGTQQIITNVSLPMQVKAGDMDGDTDNDFVISTLGGDIYYVANLGSGSFGPAQTVLNGPFGENGIALVDVDLDTDLDLIVANPNNDQVGWYSNSGTGSFGSFQFLTFILDQMHAL